ncbi:nuclear transport factor 2 family protein [Microbispora cellulosiformans]|uniref:Nuclear transport factor 2 family protein n=1 Tax=Microbispora cellulosiformans TaxID=2614688 RepID=A0A5J5K4G4_9ACTN|nr:nuclear transport factor 2 family protein [Microbispora cellulosiformans]KAA9379198.1 nuclear transport factor 2 family protein [Microbispora cellulosiformans]
MTTTTDRQELFHAMLTRLPGELAFGEEDPGRILDRYYTPDIEHHNDGIPLDRERLIAHARPARKNVLAVRVEVREILVAGDRAAARFTLAADMRKGATIVTEIFMFGRFAPDGRIRRLDSLTRTVPDA